MPTANKHPFPHPPRYKAACTHDENEIPHIFRTTLAAALRIGAYSFVAVVAPVCLFGAAAALVVSETSRENPPTARARGHCRQYSRGRHGQNADYGRAGECVAATRRACRHHQPRLRADIAGRPHLAPRKFGGGGGRRAFAAVPPNARADGGGRRPFCGRLRLVAAVSRYSADGGRRRFAALRAAP